MELAHLLPRVEEDAVRLKFGSGDAPGPQILNQLLLVNPVLFLDMEDKFVHFKRVVLVFAQFQLPGADVFDVERALSR